MTVAVDVAGGGAVGGGEACCRRSVPSVLVPTSITGATPPARSPGQRLLPECRPTPAWTSSWGIKRHAHQAQIPTGQCGDTRLNPWPGIVYNIIGVLPYLAR